MIGFIVVATVSAVGLIDSINGLRVCGILSGSVEVLSIFSVTGLTLSITV